MPGPFVHNIDPIIGLVGGFCLCWYGLSYTLGAIQRFPWKRIPKKGDAMNNEEIRPLFETPHFKLEPCRDCRLPGYLILSPKVPVRSFSDMAPAVLEDLGIALGRAFAGIEAVIEPERIYVARFGEGTASIHLHLFPRTAELRDVYLRDRGDEGVPLSGPLILDWARKRYRAHGGDPSLGPECHNAASALRAWFTRT